ncbi:MAG TPA: hypothetical protein DC047_05405 [Blastocatellia bacterium]|nr:hypothetical protein [Blastocatellia bacterium]
MAVNRRQFIKTGTLVAVAAGIPLKVAAETFNQPNSSASVLAAPVSPLHGASSHFDMATFAQQLNTNFRLSHSGKTAVVKLVEVKDWRDDPAKKTGRECFSLVFSGPSSLIQNTYSVDHGTLGSFSLLVVPSAEGKRYEALFNRLH